jgi:hypothetical protein
MKTQSIKTIPCVLGLLLTACGTPSTNDAANDGLPRPEPEAPVTTVLTGRTIPVNPIDLVPGPGGGFNIGEHPSDDFERGTCTTTQTYIYGPGEHPLNDFVKEAGYRTAQDMAEHATQVLRVRIDQVSPGSAFAPIGVEDELPLDADGNDANVYTLDLTQVKATVTEVLLGDAKAGAEILITELGCLPEKSTASTTPGAEILLVASDVTPGRSPDAALGSTYHTLDWMEIAADGRLLPRRGVEGSPPLALFMEGNTLDGVRREIEQIKVEK